MFYHSLPSKFIYDPKVEVFLMLYIINVLMKTSYFTLRTEVEMLGEIT